MTKLEQKWGLELAAIASIPTQEQSMIFSTLLPVCDTGRLITGTLYYTCALSDDTLYTCFGS